jgi:tetrahydromethanopterin S-methyltransferase subunit E
MSRRIIFKLLKKNQNQGEGNSNDIRNGVAGTVTDIVLSSVEIIRILTMRFGSMTVAHPAIIVTMMRAYTTARQFQRK